MEEYIRRTAEIQLAVLVRYAYTMHKNTLGVINFFKGIATIANIPHQELLETAIINYKKLLPTKEELIAISDLAIKKRQTYFKSGIMNTMYSERSCYRLLGDIDRDFVYNLKPKTEIILSDTIVMFMKEFSSLFRTITPFLLDIYDV